MRVVERPELVLDRVPGAGQCEMLKKLREQVYDSQSLLSLSDPGDRVVSVCEALLVLLAYATRLVATNEVYDARCRDRCAWCAAQGESLRVQCLGLGRGTDTE